MGLWRCWIIFFVLIFFRFKAGSVLLAHSQIVV